MTLLDAQRSRLTPERPTLVGRSQRVPFRFRAFLLHLLGSATLLALVLGVLYVGWYRWPGWYLAGMPHVAMVLVAVDVAVGPLLTLVIASPAKPRRVLARDIAVIVAVQLVALTYGSVTLWRGRPLYYAFSVDRLQMVQAYDLDAPEIALGRQHNPELAPTWHSRPRWIWAPLPDDPKIQNKIVASTIAGGADVIQMPRYFKPWDRGLPELRRQLKEVGDLKSFTKPERQVLKRRMLQQGFSVDQPTTMLFTGRAGAVLAVFDRKTMRLAAVLAPD